MQKTKSLFFGTYWPKINASAFVPLISIVFLSIILRLYNLGEWSIWYDEAATVRNVLGLLRLSPYEDWGLFGLLRAERVPPLYFFYVLPFYYFSSIEWSLRLSSVIVGIATIPLMYYFGSRLLNQKIGLIAALLLTFSPFHIYYSQELRPYSMFLFFSILVLYLAYLALEENKTIYYIGFTIASVLSMYTHTYTVFLLFIVDLYFILNWKLYYPLLQKWFVVHFIFAILIIPEIYHSIIHITSGATGLSDYPVGLRSIAGMFYLFTVGRVFLPTRTNLVFILIQAVIYGGGLVVGIWTLWTKRIAQGRRQASSFFTASGISYLIICSVSLTVIPLFDEARAKYMIFFLPFYYLLIATGWVHLFNFKLQVVLLSLAISVSLISIFPFYFKYDQVGKGSFRIAAEHLQHKFDENDMIYHVSRQTKLPFAYYFDWQVPQLLLHQYDPNYVTSDRFWLVSYSQTAGFELGLASFQDEQIDFPKEQYKTASVCNNYINDESFDIIEHYSFSGKNTITVCLYERK